MTNVFVLVGRWSDLIPTHDRVVQEFAHGSSAGNDREGRARHRVVRHLFDSEDGAGHARSIAPRELRRWIRGRLVERKLILARSFRPGGKSGRPDYVRGLGRAFACAMAV